MSMQTAAVQTLQQHAVYGAGDSDSRPWGSYEVLEVGRENNEEFCEKRISVEPYKALSLQRHQGRREVWRVEEGELTVIVDGTLHTLSKGDTILIPLKAAHCMMNLTGAPVVVYEKQIGICREEDNDRLCDLSGRETVMIDGNDHKALKSKEIYEEVTKELLTYQ